MKKRKLLLIGWDAADWRVIDQLMAEGMMPALATFLQRGVRGNIATLSPSLSPILWTSIATGKRAYDHGVCGFVEELKAEGRIVPVRSTSRQCKAVWNILNEAGLKTNIVNWWPSYPAEILDGVSISNHFHKSPPSFGKDWPLEQAVIHPESFQDKLKDFRVHPAELGLAHITPFIPDAATLDPEKDPVLKSCLRILAHCSSVHNAATWLMEHTDWDFMAVYQEAIDHFSHLAMKYHPPKLPDTDQEEFERYKHIITAAYRFHDMMLERLLELAGPECDVVLISDHGFESGKGRISQLPDIPAAPALEHRKYGICAAAGPSFKPGTQVFGMSLLDVAPAILHHFSLPVAEDMEGKVPTELYQIQEPVSRIPSWEMTGNAPKFLNVEDVPSRDTLDQLSELGYVQLPENNKQEYVRRELLYNRNLSLLEGGYYSKVVEEIVPEWNSSHELRFGLLLAHALQNMHRTKEWSELINEMKESHPGNAAVLFQSGMMALGSGEYQKALDLFEEIEGSGIKSSQLFTEIARAWLVAGNRKRAAEYFDKALNEDPGSTRAMTGRAQVMIEEGRNEDALLLLEESLGLRFFQPQAHYLLGMISWQAGDHDTALKALTICLSQAPRHLAARKLLAELTGTQDESDHDPVIVVSGWPRSGTSMMMRMLEAGGLEVFTDSKRAADQHNPEGYYEHSAVLRIGQKQDWLPSARGKAVKIVLPLLRYLPASEYYHVIVMKRPLTEVVISQEKMKGANKADVMKNFPFQTAVNLQNEEERMERWLRSQAHIKLHYVELAECINNAREVIQALSSFLGKDLDHEKAVKVPEGKAQNTKLGE